MVFNSFPFVFLFLPITLAGFFFLGRRNVQWAALWLALASLFFYGWWDYRYVPILVGSMLFNCWAGRRLSLAPHSMRSRWLSAAIAVNLLLLAYFKYTNFFIATINGVAGSHIPKLELILPIGISFFTFTQIAFLVDARHDRIGRFSFLHYLLFASYFPYIVAGPILHHKEMIPQFAEAERYRARLENIATGVAIFVFGLAKKVLLADNLAPLVNPVFHDPHPQLLQAWMGVLAYSLQLYFDFSGYSDMAIGVSRLLGFHLPLNFNSPYKAANISDFWRRWHMSLSGFLRNYLYIPLGGNRHGTMKRYRNLMLTMVLGGLWHGANWTFVIWGGLHGLYLCIHHGWQSSYTRHKESMPCVPIFINRILTFVAVLVAWCFFRSPDVATAFNILAGMAGMNGFSSIIEGNTFDHTILFICAGIAFFMPNTQEIMSSHEQKKTTSLRLERLAWSPSLGWGLITALLFALSVLSLDRVTDFIYVQF